MKESVARCHLLARVLAADGIITPEERDLLNTTMAQLQLDDTERDHVTHFEHTNGAEVTLRALPEDDRRAFLDTLVEAALVDGRLTPHEVATIKAINRSLGLDKPT